MVAAMTTLLLMRPDREDLRATAARIAPHIHRTPVLTSGTIDRIAGARLFFKCENFQKVGAFKMRGAANAVGQLDPAQKRHGVATHSSGNFAQALARAAESAKLPCHIVMPRTAPEIKRRATQAYGATIIDCEPTLADREKTLAGVVERTGATFIHPFNHLHVIAGQATAAMELLEQVEALDYIVAPVGGGGLIAGTALAAHYFSPATQVFGGEPSGADDAYRSLESGAIVPSVHPRTIADGLLTSLGDLTFPIIRELVTGIVRVEEDEIIAAMRLIWERMKIVIEPSAAVAVAAVLRSSERVAGTRVGVILSGGNVDLNRLPF
jgi:threonine dehydratase